MTRSGAITESVGRLLVSVDDFPSPGIRFWDLTGVLADPEGFAATIDWLAGLVAPGTVDTVVGVEARGFLLGAAVARTLGTGVVPVRKPGKLPRVAARESYDLEYGPATLELPADVLHPGQRALLVDDVLATGGTAAAACTLVEGAGATVAAFGVVMELPALAGRARLGHRPVHALLER